MSIFDESPALKISKGKIKVEMVRDVYPSGKFAVFYGKKKSKMETFRAKQSAIKFMKKHPSSHLFFPQKIDTFKYKEMNIPVYEYHTKKLKELI